MEGKFYFQDKLPLSGESVDTHVHMHNAYNGQARKARAGAKRHINKIARRIENAATKRIADDEHSDQDT